MTDLPIRLPDRMPDQDGFGDNGPEATRLSEPDDGDDGMQKKSENVAHAPDGIKLKNLKNSVRLPNSPRTPRGENIRSGGPEPTTSY